MGVLATGGRDGGNGPGLGGDVHPLPPEHYFPIHRDSSDIGAVSGGRAMVWSMGSTEMVGTRAGVYLEGVREALRLA